jgi:hypothetical protein
MTGIRLAAAGAAFLLWSGAAAAQDMKDMPMPGMGAPPAPKPQIQPAPKTQTLPTVYNDVPGKDMKDGGMEGMDMGEMTGLLGSYPMSRDASGTSWEPDASSHGGIMIMKGPWSYMVHGLINGVLDDQSGPRGGREGFASGMLMAEARHDLPNLDSLAFRAMLSPDPFMGPRGYPELLQAGETADGVTPLVDRQHPHDLFMELSATYTHRFSEHDSLYVYGGLPGEPAFGPPTFMHRQSVMDVPESPISHHWLDSTHVSFGVVTAGWVHDNVKLEASAFKGREPDQHRWDIESPKLDSAAVRLSWNPGEHWALQTSWAWQKSPEQLEPSVDQRKWSVSAMYTTRVGEHGSWASTLAWARRQGVGGPQLDAWDFENELKPDDHWTLFGRWEQLANDELTIGLMNGPVHTVSRVTLGAIHDWRVARHVKFGIGALYDFDFVPDGLAASYGSSQPHGSMGFVRLKLD